MQGTGTPGSRVFFLLPRWPRGGIGQLMQKEAPPGTPSTAVTGSCGNLFSRKLRCQGASPDDAPGSCNCRQRVTHRDIDVGMSHRQVEPCCGSSTSPGTAKKTQGHHCSQGQVPDCTTTPCPSSCCTLQKPLVAGR